MKKLEFTTWKGRFVVVDTVDRDNYYEVLRGIIPDAEFIGIVKELSEEQASEIVETHKAIEIDEETGRVTEWETNPLKGLYSLIRLKGYHLYRNPVQKSIKNLSEKEQHYRQLDTDWLEAERKTLFNPVIFKIK